MEELTIYKYQAELIENSLREVSNLLKAHTKDTCLKRNLMEAQATIENVLANNKDKEVKRF